MQHEMKLGTSGKSIIFDDERIPTRGASLSTRASWAAHYLRRLRNGDKVTLRNVDLALKWIDELVMLR